ncbi:MAG TPA: MerR family transcriptional regulator [Chloroflexia bacterium]|nr:MerR family transcriptional regulator [Chloroflexia bacterium]
MRPAIYAYKARSGSKGGEPDITMQDDIADFTDSTDDMEASSTAPSGGKGSRNSTRNPKSQGLRQITADRPIFTLSVAADLLGLHPRTLRIYEEKKLVVPARTGGNRRRYSQMDIEKFQAIRLLTRGGVNLEGVRIILEMTEELTRLGGDPTAIIERNLQSED